MQFRKSKIKFDYQSSFSKINETNFMNIQMWNWKYTTQSISLKNMLCISCWKRTCNYDRKTLLEIFYNWLDATSYYFLCVITSCLNASVFIHIQQLMHAHVQRQITTTGTTSTAIVQQQQKLKLDSCVAKITREASIKPSVMPACIRSVRLSVCMFVCCSVCPSISLLFCVLVSPSVDRAYIHIQSCIQWSA